ncbi:MAG: DNA alkylation repair protein [Actinomycetes bacterium]
MTDQARPADVAALVAEIDRRLREAARPERAEHERGYLKSELEHLGVSVPGIRAVAKDILRAHADLGHDEIVALTEALWEAPVHERRMAAVELLDLYGDRLGPQDLVLVERFVRESRTWALVDGLAASVAGSLVDRWLGSDAVVGSTLDRWAADGDFWVRRAALLSLLPGLRRGDGDFARFGRYADAMLDEKEFFVRKAIGWVLRETGKRRPDLVVAWLTPRVGRASGVTLREAVKYLPADQRDALLAAASGSR